MSALGVASAESSSNQVKPQGSKRTVKSAVLPLSTAMKPDRVVERFRTGQRKRGLRS